MYFAAGPGQILGSGAVEMLAGGEVDHAVVAEIDRAAVMFRVGVLRILIEDVIHCRHGAGQRGVGGEARKPILVRAGGVENVVVVIGDEIRIDAIS